MQKLGFESLPLAVGKHARCAITNPPGILKSFVTSAGRARFEEDASLGAVRRLVASATSFWDVGANCGLFSLYALDENPDLSVVSIEATTEHYHALCSNWLLQPSNRWVCLHTAVGDHDGTAYMSRRLGGYDHVIEDARGSAKVDVELRPMSHLDGLARLLNVDTIDVMKLDVEGYELTVLHGAADLLKRRSIGALVVEADGHGQRYGHGEEEIFRFLQAQGYRLAQSLSRTGDPSGNCLVFVSK
jgi:FkbM family methyltransferase